MSCPFKIVQSDERIVTIPKVGTFEFNIKRLSKHRWQEFLTTEHASQDFPLNERYALKKNLQEVCLKDFLCDCDVWCICWCDFKEHMLKLLPELYTDAHYPICRSHSPRRRCSPRREMCDEMERVHMG